MSSAEPEDERRGSNLASRSNLLGLGWQIASTLFLFTAGGYALDRWLGTLPWFLLAGAVLGMIGVFFQVFRIAAELDRAEKEKKRRRARSAERRIGAADSDRKSDHSNPH